MAKPRTLTDAVGLVRQSRLLTETSVGGVADRIRSGDFRGLTPDDLFACLVREGTLTSFQARQLAAGRWRGLVLRKYKLLAKLGKGGTGQVYLAEHLTLGRQVAVKVLAEDVAEDPIAQTRLIREARAAAGLDHPNIVRVFDLDPDATPPYLVMEFVDGISLQAAVAVAGTFGAEAVALVGRQVAHGLQHAWENGLVHRDVKPANLMLDRTGVVRVLDLGIVRTNYDDGLTAGGEEGRKILGTVDYLAPEQAVDSSTVDCRADVYGLGATLYFLLAGHPPFAEVPPVARLLHKQKADPTPIHQLRPDVPLGLSLAITAMIARQPSQRPQTPAAAALALAPFAIPAVGFPDDVFTALKQDRHVRHSTVPAWQSEQPTPESTAEITLPVVPSARTPVIRPAEIRLHSSRRTSRRSVAPRGNLLLWVAMGVALAATLLAVVAWWVIR